jgi:hypothetical protein
MRKHRSPRDRVSNDVHPHNTENTDNPGPPDTPDTPSTPDTPDTFDPGEALQSLHMEVVELEAFANAANEAVVQLPYPADREERRPFDRVYTLVGKVADETNAVVSHGGKLVDALQAYLQRKRALKDA